MVKKNKPADLSHLHTLFSDRLFFQRLSELGIFIRDMDQGLLLTSSFWSQMGYDSDPDFTWKEKLHPDDKNRFEEVWEAFFSGKLPKIQLEYRILDSKGQYHWVSGTILVLSYDKNSRVKTYIGMDFSMNEIRSRLDHIDQSQRMASDSLHDLLQIQTTMKDLFQVASLVEYWDKLLEKFLDLDSWTYSLFIRPVDIELNHDSPTDLVMSAWLQNQETGIQQVSLVHTYPENLWSSLVNYINRHNRPRYGRSLPIPLRRFVQTLFVENPKGDDFSPNWMVIPFTFQRTTIGVLLFGIRNGTQVPAEAVRQIILMSDHWQSSYEKIIEISSLEKIAKQDDLTSVMGRRGFHLIAEQWFVDQRPFLLIIIDIDNFKTFNDSFGHAMGDTIILEVVSAMTYALSNVNHAIGRFGGDEFMAVIECLDASMGCTSTELIRHMLQLATERKALPQVTLSIGAAHSREGFTSLSAIFSSADARLLSAKRMGRNRIVWENESCKDLELQVRQFEEM
jgi:diguanylate cyclase (GGDEF)-like protein